MAEFEGMDEATLRKLLEEAENYEERSRIRGAIRELRKAAGLETKRPTGKSSYVRPGMGLNSPNITIPNSVTGNVLPTKLVSGKSVKPPDKSTPTIGYLNSATTQTKKTRHNSGSQSSAHTFGSVVPSTEESWWKGSRGSTSTTGSTPEPRVTSENRSSEAVTEATRTPSPLNESSTSLQKPDEYSSHSETNIMDHSEQSDLKHEEELFEPEEESFIPREESKEESYGGQEVEPDAEEQITNASPEYSPEPVVEDNQPEEEERIYQNDYTPSPEHNQDKMADDEEGYDDNYDDEEVEELKNLRDDDETDINASQSTGIKLEEHLRQVEPGLGEDLDFRRKLRRADEAKIDTTAAFPEAKSKGEQVDFRNVLRKTDGPEKKSFKGGSIAQVDFRDQLKNPKETAVTSHDSADVVHVEEVNDNAEPDLIEDVCKAKEQSDQYIKEDESTNIPADNKSIDEVDSYEARREARRKAREERRKKAAEEEQGKPTMSYREQQKLEQSKRMQENKKKWAERDGADGDSIEKPTIQKQKGTGTQQLLAWCQHKTRYYENVEVKDFSTSWADGLALCAILHSFMPHVIPYDDLTTDNPRENFTIALEAADAAGIGAFFDVEDILIAKIPDPKSMMTFLATIYQHFK